MITDYIVFFLVVMAATFFLPEVFRKSHVPHLILLILAGMIIGPFGLEIMAVTDSIHFIGMFALVYMMFVIGLGVDIKHLKKANGKSILVATLNLVIPLLTGTYVGIYIGLQMLPAMILGTVFATSSVSIVIPFLEKHKLLKGQMGTSIVVTSVFENIASLVIFAVLLHAIVGVSALSLWGYLIGFLIFLFAIFWLLPIAEKKFLNWEKFGKDPEDREVRFVFFTLLAVAFIAELIGLPAMIGAFIAGVALAGVLKHEKVMNKIHAIGYGFLIPVFMFYLGMRTNLALISSGRDIATLLLIIFTLIISKAGSGAIGAELIGLPRKKALGIGLSSIPQMTTTLAIVAIAGAFGIFNDALLTMIVVVAIVTSLIAPVLLKTAYHWKEL
ncbi:cation:proton antiporter [Candidatus Undinarchaeota archaeon]